MDSSSRNLDSDPISQQSGFAYLTAEQLCLSDNFFKAHHVDFHRSVPYAGQRSRSECHRDFSFDTFTLPSSYLEWLSSNKPLTDDSVQLPTSIDKFHQAEVIVHTYNNFTIGPEEGGLENDVHLAEADEVEQSNKLELSEEFTDFHTPELNQLLNEEVVRSDLLDNSFWLSEFEGMEMLDGFQNYYVEEVAEPEKSQPTVPCTPEFAELKKEYIPEENDSPFSTETESIVSSSSSPSYVYESNHSDSENSVNLTEVYSKVFSSDVIQSSESSESSLSKRVSPRINLPVSSIPSLSLSHNHGGPRKRGRQSKDEQLAIDHRLPATAEELTYMSHLELQKHLANPQLSTAQKTMIKKIRRRGRNKVAARKCRQRRMLARATVIQQQRPLQRPQRRSANKTRVISDM